MAEDGRIVRDRSFKDREEIMHAEQVARNQIREFEQSERYKQLQARNQASIHSNNTNAKHRHRKGAKVTRNVTSHPEMKAVSIYIIYDHISHTRAQSEIKDNINTVCLSYSHTTAQKQNLKLHFAQ